MPEMLRILIDNNPHFHPKQYVRQCWKLSHKTIFNTYEVMKNSPKKYVNPDSPISIIMEVAYNAIESKNKSDKSIMRLH